MFEDMHVMHIGGMEFAHMVTNLFGRQYDSEVGTGLTDSWYLVTVVGDLPDGFPAEDVADLMDAWLDSETLAEQSKNSPPVEVVLYVMHRNKMILAGNYLIGMGL